jgi:hypothetical protein
MKAHGDSKTPEQLEWSWSEPAHAKRQADPANYLCPQCGSDMIQKMGINWLTIGALFIFLPLGFILFILTGIAEKRAVCTKCSRKESLYRVF